MSFNRIRLLHAMAIALGWAFSTASFQTAAQEIEIGHYTHRDAWPATANDCFPSTP